MARLLQPVREGLLNVIPYPYDLDMIYPPNIHDLLSLEPDYPNTDPPAPNFGSRQSRSDDARDDAGRPARNLRGETARLWERLPRLSADALLQRVWGPEWVSEGWLLRNVVKKRRRKPGYDAADPRCIITEPRMGYRISSEVGGQLALGVPASFAARGVPSRSRLRKCARWIPRMSGGHPFRCDGKWQHRCRRMWRWVENALGIKNRGRDYIRGPMGWMRLS